MASTSPPHVLIVIENLPAPFDRRVWHEATTLRDAGYAVTIICPTGGQHEPGYERLDGIDIHRHLLPTEAEGAVGYMREYGAALFHETRLAWRVWRAKRFDVIHACNPPDLIFLVALPYKLVRRVKFVFDHHDLNPELFDVKFAGRGGVYRLFRRAVRLVERATFKLADMVISTNHSYARIAVERGGVARDRVHVVRSGPKLERMFRVEPNAALKKGKRHLVGYVGVMGAQEGIDLLLEVVAILRDEFGRDDVQFALVGGGTSKDAMEARAAEMGLGDRVEFLGRVPDEVMREVLSTADLCVNSDSCNEMNDKSTMNKVMEYMAMGKPIVQFDLTEGRFSARDASLYAKPGDTRDFAKKIDLLLRNPAMRAEMGAFGERRVRDELAWTHEAPKLLDAYRQLLGASRTPEALATRRGDGAGAQIEETARG